MSQTEFGELGGVKKLAQFKYEAGERTPDTAYLELLAGNGVDVGYILTGIRTLRRPGMSQAEIDEFNELVDDYWNLDDEDRAQVRVYVMGLVASAVRHKGGTRGIRKLPRDGDKTE